MPICMLDRQHTETIDRLLRIWESSVRATHTFLTEQALGPLRPQVVEALGAVEYLYGYRDQDGLQAFLGVQDGKLEMLFVDAAQRGGGIGKQLVQFAVEDLGVTEVDVNEQNPQAVGFYEHMGFAVHGRSPLDGMGNPYPLLHMRRTEQPE